MSDKTKRDNAKNPSGPASGRPGAEGDRSKNAPRAPVQEQNSTHVPAGPKGRQTDHGGQPHAGSGNRISDRDNSHRG